MTFPKLWLLLWPTDFSRFLACCLLYLQWRSKWAKSLHLLIYFNSICSFKFCQFASQVLKYVTQTQIMSERSIFSCSYCYSEVLLSVPLIRLLCWRPYEFMDLLMIPCVGYEGQWASKGTEGIFSSVKMNILNCHLRGVYKIQKGF